MYHDLGAAFMVTVYEQALARELERLGLKAERQVPITVRHRNRPVGHFRADIVVSDLVLLELKARNQLEASHPSTPLDQ